MSRRKMLVADLLCGAGGSSTGCEQALRDLGVEMELVCVNHWGVAIETHKKNHPTARHYVQDIATVRPHLIVPEGYLDLLMASPTCTHHSVARGGKPTSDQQRSDPWHIITWFTELRVKRAIIENVWEYLNWGPVDPRTNRPIKSRKGEYYRAWIDVIWKLGATSIEWRKLNSANYGEAQTRQRYICKIRFDKVQIGWAPITHAKRADEALQLFPDMKPWRPAREIIDWSIKGRSIFNRKKPLAPKTLARIYAGAVKFKWPEPFLVILRNHMDGKSIDGPVPAIAANGNHVGLAQPVFAHAEVVPGERGNKAVVHLAMDDGGAEPVIINGRKGNQAKAASIDPIPTLDTKGGVWLAEPLILSQHSSGTARAAADPLPTVMTGGASAENHPGCARPMLVEPFILNRHGDNGGTRAHTVTDPAPTLDCRGAGYIIEPFVLSREGGGAPRSIAEPTPTQVAKHSHCLISPYYGSGSGETCSSDQEPLPTITSKDRFGIVVPVTHTRGGNTARDVNTDQLPTLTTAKGGELAIVMPVTHEGTGDRSLDPGKDPLPTVTGAHRGELAFIVAQHGERQGQQPRVHDVDDPTPTVAASGHVDLIEATQQYDILFRMLEPAELAAAMGFDIDGLTYVFAGNKTEQVKQIGNAVSVRMMKAEVGAICADVAPSISAQKSAA